MSAADRATAALAEALNVQALDFKPGPWGSNPQDVARMEALSWVLDWLRNGRAAAVLAALDAQPGDTEQLRRTNGDVWAEHGHRGVPCSPPDAVRGRVSCRLTAQVGDADEEAEAVWWTWAQREGVHRTHPTMKRAFLAGLTARAAAQAEVASAIDRLIKTTGALRRGSDDEVVGTVTVSDLRRILAAHAGGDDG